ncbi:MAG: hypothetical protein HGB00_07040 [Chlorobiaceae bacterium]|nr:hypothetical protein [Chlorobiaceae bacterium]
MRLIRYILLSAFILMMYGNRGISAETELNRLKTVLFSTSEESPSLPVSADPPTGDYNDLSNGRFSFLIDDDQIHQIVRYKNELEPMILERIDSDYSWMYLSAFLGYESAVPAIKKKLLDCKSLYGWEGPDYSQLETYLVDAQYPYQMACINAIEYITKKPLGLAITLTCEELDDLEGRAKKCTEENIDRADFADYCSAYWLLGKLKTERPPEP